MKNETYKLILFSIFSIAEIMVQLKNYILHFFVQFREI